MAHFDASQNEPLRSWSSLVATGKSLTGIGHLLLLVASAQSILAERLLHSDSFSLFLRPPLLPFLLAVVVVVVSAAVVAFNVHSAHVGWHSLRSCLQPVNAEPETLEAAAAAVAATTELTSQPFHALDIIRLLFADLTSKNLNHNNNNNGTSTR